MAALQTGPLDNPDNIFQDDLYSAFDSSYIDHDDIFSSIDDENKYFDKNNEEYSEILDTIIRTIDIDLNKIEKMDSYSSIEILKLLLSNDAPNIPDDDNSKKIAQMNKVKINSRAFHGTYQQKRRLLNQKYIDEYRYKKLLKKQNFDRKLRVLAMKVIIIGGKLCFKTIMSSNLGVVLIPYFFGDNAFSLLNKSKVDYLLLVLETLGIVPSHQIAQLASGFDSTTELFMRYIDNDKIKHIIEGYAFVSSRRHWSSIGPEPPVNPDIFLRDLKHKYFVSGTIDFKKLNDPNNIHDKELFEKIWTEFIKIPTQSREKDNWTIFDLIFETATDSVKTKTQEINLDTNKDVSPKNKIEIMKKIIKGESLVGQLSSYLDDDDSLSKKFDKLFGDAVKKASKPKISIDYNISSEEHFKDTMKQIYDDVPSMSSSRKGSDIGGGLVGLAHNLFSISQYQSSITGIVHTGLNSDVYNLLGDAAFIYTDSTIPENEEEIFIKTQLKQNLKAMTLSPYLKEIIDDNWKNFKIALSITGTDIHLGYVDNKANPDNGIFQWMNISAGSVGSYILELVIDKAIYIPPPPEDIVIEKDKKLQDLEDKINFRMNLYNKGLSDIEVSEEFDEKFNSSEVYTSVLGKSLNKFYKTGSFKSIESIFTHSIASGTALFSTNLITSLFFDPNWVKFREDLTTGTLSTVTAIGKNEKRFLEGKTVLFSLFNFFINVTEKQLEPMKKMAGVLPHALYNPIKMVEVLKIIGEMGSIYLKESVKSGVKGLDEAKELLFNKKLNEIYKLLGYPVDDSTIMGYPKRKLINTIFSILMKLQNELVKIMSDCITFVRNNFPDLTDGKRNYVINILFNNRIVKSLVNYTDFLAKAISQYLVNENISSLFSKFEYGILDFNSSEFVKNFNKQSFEDIVLYINKSLPNVLGYFFSNTHRNSDFNIWTHLASDYIQNRENQEFNSLKPDTNPLIGSYLTEQVDGEFNPFWKFNISNILLAPFPDALQINIRNLLISIPGGEFITSDIDILRYVNYIITMGSYKSQDYRKDTSSQLKQFTPGKKKCQIVASNGGKVLCVNMENNDKFYENEQNRVEFSRLIFDFLDSSLTDNRLSLSTSQRDIITHDLKILNGEGDPSEINFKDLKILNHNNCSTLVLSSYSKKVCMDLKDKFIAHLQRVRESRPYDSVGIFIEQVLQRHTNIDSSYDIEFNDFFEKDVPIHKTKDFESEKNTLTKKKREQNTSKNIADYYFLLQYGVQNGNNSELFDGKKNIVINDEFFTEATGVDGVSKADSEKEIIDAQNIDYIKKFISGVCDYSKRQTDASGFKRNIHIKLSRFNEEEIKKHLTLSELGCQGARIKFIKNGEQQPPNAFTLKRDMGDKVSIDSLSPINLAKYFYRAVVVPGDEKSLSEESGGVTHTIHHRRIVTYYDFWGNKKISLLDLPVNNVEQLTFTSSTISNDSDFALPNNNPITQITQLQLLRQKLVRLRKDTRLTNYQKKLITQKINQYDIEFKSLVDKINGRKKDLMDHFQFAESSDGNFVGPYNSLSRILLHSDKNKEIFDDKELFKDQDNKTTIAKCINDCLITNNFTQFQVNEDCSNLTTMFFISILLNPIFISCLNDHSSNPNEKKIINKKICELGNLINRDFFCINNDKIKVLINNDCIGEFDENVFYLISNKITQFIFNKNLKNLKLEDNYEITDDELRFKQAYLCSIPQNENQKLNKYEQLFNTKKSSCDSYSKILVYSGNNSLLVNLSIEILHSNNKITQYQKHYFEKLNNVNLSYTTEDWVKKYIEDINNALGFNNNNLQRSYILTYLVKLFVEPEQQKKLLGINDSESIELLPMNKEHFLQWNNDNSDKWSKNMDCVHQYIISYVKLHRGIISEQNVKKLNKLIEDRKIIAGSKSDEKSNLDKLHDNYSNILLVLKSIFGEMSENDIEYSDRNKTNHSFLQEVLNYERKGNVNISSLKDNFTQLISNIKSSLLDNLKRKTGRTIPRRSLPMHQRVDKEALKTKTKTQKPPKSTPQEKEHTKSTEKEDTELTEEQDTELTKEEEILEILEEVVTTLNSIDESLKAGSKEQLSENIDNALTESLRTSLTNFLGFFGDILSNLNTNPGYKANTGSSIGTNELSEMGDNTDNITNEQRQSRCLKLKEYWIAVGDASHSNRPHFLVHPELELQPSQIEFIKKNCIKHIIQDEQSRVNKHYFPFDMKITSKFSKLFGKYTTADLRRLELETLGPRVVEYLNTPIDSMTGCIKFMWQILQRDGSIEFKNLLWQLIFWRPVEILGSIGMCIISLIQYGGMTPQAAAAFLLCLNSSVAIQSYILEFFNVMRNYYRSSYELELEMSQMSNPVLLATRFKKNREELVMYKKIKKLKERIFLKDNTEFTSIHTNGEFIFNSVTYQKKDIVKIDLNACCDRQDKNYKLKSRDELNGNSNCEIQLQENHDHNTNTVLVTSDMLAEGQKEIYVLRKTMITKKQTGIHNNIPKFHDKIDNYFSFIPELKDNSRVYKSASEYTLDEVIEGEIKYSDNISEDEINKDKLLRRTLLTELYNLLGSDVTKNIMDNNPTNSDMFLVDNLGGLSKENTIRPLIDAISQKLWNKSYDQLIRPTVQYSEAKVISESKTIESYQRLGNYRFGIDDSLNLGTFQSSVKIGYVFKKSVELLKNSGNSGNIENYSKLSEFILGDKLKFYKDLTKGGPQLKAYYGDKSIIRYILSKNNFSSELNSDDIKTELSEFLKEDHAEAAIFLHEGLKNAIVKRQEYIKELICNQYKLMSGRNTDYKLTSNLGAFFNFAIPNPRNYLLNLYGIKQYHGDENSNADNRNPVVRRNNAENRQSNPLRLSCDLINYDDLVASAPNVSARTRRDPVRDAAKRGSLHATKNLIALIDLSKKIKEEYSLVSAFGEENLYLDGKSHKEKQDYFNKKREMEIFACKEFYSDLHRIQSETENADLNYNRYYLRSIRKTLNDLFLEKLKGTRGEIRNTKLKISDFFIEQCVGLIDFTHSSDDATVSTYKPIFYNENSVNASGDKGQYVADNYIELQLKLKEHEYKVRYKTALISCYEKILGISQVNIKLGEGLNIKLSDIPGGEKSLDADFSLKTVIEQKFPDFFANTSGSNVSYNDNLTKDEILSVYKYFLPWEFIAPWGELNPDSSGNQLDKRKIEFGTDSKYGTVKDIGSDDWKIKHFFDCLNTPGINREFYTDKSSAAHRVDLKSLGRTENELKIYADHIFSLNPNIKEFKQAISTDGLETKHSVYLQWLDDLKDNYLFKIEDNSDNETKISWNYKWGLVTSGTEKYLATWNKIIDEIKERLNNLVEKLPDTSVYKDNLVRFRALQASPDTSSVNNPNVMHEGSIQFTKTDSVIKARVYENGQLQQDEITIAEEGDIPLDLSILKKVLKNQDYQIDTSERPTLKFFENDEKKSELYKLLHGSYKMCENTESDLSSEEGRICYQRQLVKQLFNKEIGFQEYKHKSKFFKEIMSTKPTSMYEISKYGYGEGKLSQKTEQEMLKISEKLQLVRFNEELVKRLNSCILEGFDSTKIQVIPYNKRYERNVWTIDGTKLRMVLDDSLCKDYKLVPKIGTHDEDGKDTTNSGNSKHQMEDVQLNKEVLNKLTEFFSHLPAMESGLPGKFTQCIRDGLNEIIMEFIYIQNDTTLEKSYDDKIKDCFGKLRIDVRDEVKSNLKAYHISVIKILFGTNTDINHVLDEIEETPLKKTILSSLSDIIKINNRHLTPDEFHSKYGVYISEFPNLLSNLLLNLHPTNNSDFKKELKKEVTFLRESFKAASYSKLVDKALPNFRYIEVLSNEPLEHVGKIPNEWNVEKRRLLKTNGWYVGYSNASYSSNLVSMNNRDNTLEVLPPILILDKKETVVQFNQEGEGPEYYELNETDINCKTINPECLGSSKNILNIFCSSDITQHLDTQDKKAIYVHKSIVDDVSLANKLFIQKNESKQSIKIQRKADKVEDCDLFLNAGDISKINTNLNVKIDDSNKANFIISSIVPNIPVIKGSKEGLACQKNHDCLSGKCGINNICCKDPHCNDCEAQGCINCDTGYDLTLDAQGILTCEENKSKKNIYKCDKGKISVWEVDKKTHINGANEYDSIHAAHNKCLELDDSSDHPTPDSFPSTGTVPDSDTTPSIIHEEGLSGSCASGYEYKGFEGAKFYPKFCVSKLRKTFLAKINLDISSSLGKLNDIKKEFLKEGVADVKFKLQMKNNSNQQEFIKEFTDKGFDERSSDMTIFEETSETGEITLTPSPNIDVNFFVIVTYKDKSKKQFKRKILLKVGDDKIDSLKHISHFKITPIDKIPEKISTLIIEPIIVEDCQVYDQSSGECVKCKKDYRFFKDTTQENVISCIPTKYKNSGEWAHTWEYITIEGIIDFVLQKTEFDKFTTDLLKKTIPFSEQEKPLLEKWRKKIKDDFKTIQTKQNKLNGNKLEEQTHLCNIEWKILTGQFKRDQIWGYESDTLNGPNLETLETLATKSQVSSYFKNKLHPISSLRIIQILDTESNGEIKKDSFCKLIDGMLTTTTVKQELIYDIFSEKLKCEPITETQVGDKRAPKCDPPDNKADEFINNYHTDLIFSENIAQLNNADSRCEIFGISQIVSFISEKSSAIEDGRVIFKSIDDENTFYNTQDSEGTDTNPPYTLNKLPRSDEKSEKIVIHYLLGKLGYYNFNNHEKSIKKDDIRICTSYVDPEKTKPCIKYDREKTILLKNIETFTTDLLKSKFPKDNKTITVFDKEYTMMNNALASGYPVYCNDSNKEYIYFNQQTNQWHIGDLNHLKNQSVLTKKYLSVKRQDKCKKNPKCCPIDILLDPESNWIKETWTDGNLITPLSFTENNKAVFPPVSEDAQNLEYQIDNEDFIPETYLEIQIKREALYTSRYNLIDNITKILVDKISECKSLLTKDCNNLPSQEAPNPVESTQLINELTAIKNTVKVSLEKLINNCLKKPYKSKKKPLESMLNLLSTNFKVLQKEILGDIPDILDSIESCLDNKLKASIIRNETISTNLNKMKDRLETGYGIGIPKEIVEQLIIQYSSEVKKFAKHTDVDEAEDEFQFTKSSKYKVGDSVIHNARGLIKGTISVWEAKIIAVEEREIDGKKKAYVTIQYILDNGKMWRGGSNKTLTLDDLAPDELVNLEIYNRDTSISKLDAAIKKDLEIHKGISGLTEGVRVVVFGENKAITSTEYFIQRQVALVIKKLVNKYDGAPFLEKLNKLLNYTENLSYGDGKVVGTIPVSPSDLEEFDRTNIKVEDGFNGLKLFLNVSNSGIRDQMLHWKKRNHRAHKYKEGTLENLENGAYDDQKEVYKKIITKYTRFFEPIIEIQKDINKQYKITAKSDYEQCMKKNMERINEALGINQSSGLMGRIPGLHKELSTLFEEEEGFTTTGNTLISCKKSYESNLKEGNNTIQTSQIKAKQDYECAVIKNNNSYKETYKTDYLKLFKDCFSNKSICYGYTKIHKSEKSEIINQTLEDIYTSKATNIDNLVNSKLDELVNNKKKKEIDSFTEFNNSIDSRIQQNPNPNDECQPITFEIDKNKVTTESFEMKMLNIIETKLNEINVIGTHEQGGDNVLDKFLTESVDELEAIGKPFLDQFKIAKNNLIDLGTNIQTFNKRLTETLQHGSIDVTKYKGLKDFKIKINDGLPELREIITSNMTTYVKSPSQQGGTKLKKHQEINKQLKKRSIRKNKQVRNYIRISKIKPNKRKKSSKKRKSSPNTKLKNLKTIDKLLKRRSLRKSNQIRNYVRLSKMKPNKRKKSSKKRKASSNTKLKNLKTIDKLLKKRSLRKNKQIKNQIDFKSYSD